MEPNIISIRCIHCGAILQVRNQEGIEKLSVTCPNCHEKFKVAEGMASHSSTKKPDGEDTIYGPAGTSEAGDEGTTIGGSGNHAVGMLKDMASGKVYTLKQGVNTIGRASQTCGATIKIEDPTRKMSREHATIEVNIMPNGSFRHFIRNWHNKNKTYVGGVLLQEGDCFVLQNRQEIRFASVTLQFIIPEDGEETLY